MQQKSFRSQYESLGTFLVLELIALASFNLGGVSMIFHYGGFIISLVAFYFAYKSFSKEDLKPILFVSIPLLIIVILTSFGSFFEEYDIISKIGFFLAIPGFLLAGLSFRRLKSQSSRYLVLFLGGGLALLTLIGTLSTWIQYGFFYPLIYKNTPEYYYNGTLYSITKEMSWLSGFEVLEVSQSYGGLFAVLCACFLPGLLFVDCSKDKILFYSLIAIGGIGIISLISIPNFTGLIFVAIVYVVAAYYRFLRNNELANKILRFAFYIIAGFVAGFVLLVILNAAVPGLHDMIQNNGFLNRIFNENRFMIPFNPILQAALKPENFFGISHADAIKGSYETAIGTNIGSFELEILKEGGLFAFIALIAFVYIAIELVIRYLKQSNDKDYLKIILLCFLTGAFIYLSFESDVFPHIHNENFYSPVSHSLPFLLMVFVIGYIVLPKGKSEISYVEETWKQSKDSKNIDYDYEFDDIVEEEII